MINANGSNRNAVARSFLSVTFWTLSCASTQFFSALGWYTPTHIGSHTAARTQRPLSHLVVQCFVHLGELPAEIDVDLEVQVSVISRVGFHMESTKEFILFFNC